MPERFLRAQVSAIRAAVSEVWRGRWPRSYAFTFVVEIAVLLGSLVTFKIAADVLGSTGFGEFAVARRAVTVLTFPLLVGLGISLPRYVSLALGKGTVGTAAAAYSVASVFIGVPILAGFSVLALHEPDRVAQLFYGDARFAALTTPVVLAIAGLYAHTLAYANYRGRLRMWPANLLQLVNLALLPPLAVLASHGSAATAIEIIGVGWLTTSMLGGVWGVLSSSFRFSPARVVATAAKDLVRFGLPRVIGEFALFGLFALPTFYVAHTAGVERAGFFSFALSLVQVLSSLFAAVGILLLPYLSRLAGAGNWERIARVVWSSVGASLLVTVVAVAALQATLGWLVPLVMGSSFAAAVPPARWLITGAVPFVLYTLLRDPLDAIAVWPYNTVNVGVALLVVVGLLWFATGWVSPAAAVALGMLVLGVSTLLSWNRALGSARAGPTTLIGAVGGGSELGV
jgi:O-antigen/teichoic acid export membrane protein